MDKKEKIAELLKNTMEYVTKQSAVENLWKTCGKLSGLWKTCGKLVEKSVENFTA